MLSVQSLLRSTMQYPLFRCLFSTFFLHETLLLSIRLEGSMRRIFYTNPSQNLEGRGDETDKETDKEID